MVSARGAEWRSASEPTSGHEIEDALSPASTERQSGPEPAPLSTHVVMLVGNDIAVDTRVKKTAASLARLGLRVTVVGYGANGRETATMAGCDIIRVPIPWEHRNAGPIPLPRPLSRRTKAGLRIKARRERVIEWGTRTTPAPLRPARKAVKLAGLYGLRAAGAVVRRTFSDVVPVPEPQPEPSLPWRAVVPIGRDYLEALTPEIVRLRPDIIHAHDVHTIVAACAAADELESLTGTRPAWIYDAHEFIAGLSLYGSRNATERAGWLNLEQEFTPRADAVITVSPALATELARRYPQVPRVEVVLNAPWQSHEPLPREGGVRAAVGLDNETPLLVYSGVVTDARGVDTAVDAMAYLPQCHLAIVSTTYAGAITERLRARAAELGVSERVHIIPPVPAYEVVSHLATADIGLIPIKRFPSHDVALTNKLFEYIHAGLPVVVSDCPGQKRFVRTEDIGAVHVTEDPLDLALAVRAVLADLDGYRDRVRRPELRERFSWQGSERALSQLYADLLGRPLPPLPTDESFPSLHESDIRREGAPL